MLNRRGFIGALLTLLLATIASAGPLQILSGPKYTPPSGGGGGGGDDSDWQARINADGVIAFDSFESLTAGVNLDNPNTHNIVVDTTIKPAGMTGSAKFPVPSSKTSSNGNVFLDFTHDYVSGETLFFQFSAFLPPDFAYQTYPTSTSIRGWKLAIVARNDASFNTEEVTLQSQSDGLVYGYVNNGSIDTWDESISTTHSGSRTVYQPAINNGADPLAGTNPDDGSAWSNLQQDGAQFGNLLDLDTASNGWAFGLGQSMGGGYRWPVGEWGTYTVRIVKGSYGDNNSRITWAVSSESSPTPVIVYDEQVTLEDEGGQNRGWLTPFFTDRIAGGKHASAITNQIPGIALRSIGLASPNGDWTVSYTASNKRLTATPPSGGSTGAARGISAAKRFVTLHDSNAVPTSVTSGQYNSGKYLGFEVTDFNALPGSDQTMTVTVADGRNDTNVYFAQAIASWSQIKHPGGNAVPYSALSELAAALADGEWVQTPVMSGFTDSLVIDYGGDNSILEYGRRGYWDPTKQRAVFDGKSHNQNVGSDSRSATIVMDEEFVWSTLAVPGMNDDHGSGGHTGGDFTIDPATGNYYGKQYGADRTTMTLVNGTGSWTSTGIADIPGGQPISSQSALEWHPDIGSEGALINGNEGQISIWDKATDSWDEAPSAPSFPNIMGSLNNVSTWCKRNRSVYMGGGNDGGPSENWWRIGANGVPVALPDLPFTVSHSGSSGFLFPSVGNNWPLLVEHNSGEVYEFNDDTDSFDLVGQFPTALATALSTDNGWFVIPIDQYGVLLFAYMTDQTHVVTRGYLWNPPESDSLGASLHHFDDRVRVAANDDYFKRPLRKAAGF